MPDYNKGDFTQQGYGGYVSGGLHLNEKRCLTAKISTDEEQAGIDSIELNIHDHLNDLDYTITGENLTVGENVIGGGTLVSLTATENGEYDPADYEADGFSDVTVNVAGGNIPTCTITLVPAEGAINDYDLGILYNFTGSMFEGVPLTDISTEQNTVLTDLYDDDCIIGMNNYLSYVTGVYSDMVNCTIDDDLILITDTTLPSSVTITFTRIGSK